MEVCKTCGGHGLPNMCPVCYKVGNVPVKKLSAKERIARYKKKVKAREEKRKKEIEELWKQANFAKWQGNRGEYIKLVKLVKRKESKLLIEEKQL